MNLPTYQLHVKACAHAEVEYALLGDNILSILCFGFFQVLCSVDFCILLLDAFAFSIRLDISSDVFLGDLPSFVGATRSRGGGSIVGLLLKSGDLSFGFLDILRESVSMEQRRPSLWLAYLLRLSVLILLPALKFLLELVNNTGNVGLSGRWIDANLGQLLNDTNIHVELSRIGGRAVGGRRGFLALALLLTASTNKEVLIFLLYDFHAFEARVVNSALCSGSESARALLVCGNTIRGFKVLDEAFGGTDVIEKGWLRGFFKLLFSNALTLLFLVCVALGLLTITSLLV